MDGGVRLLMLLRRREYVGEKEKKVGDGGSMMVEVLDRFLKKNKEWWIDGEVFCGWKRKVEKKVRMIMLLE